MFNTGYSFDRFVIAGEHVIHERVVVYAKFPGKVFLCLTT